MLHTRPTAALVLGLTALLGAAACGSTAGSDDDPSTATPSTAGSAAETVSPGVYGAPVDPTRPEPTDVATDAPAPPAPGGGTPVLLTYSGWNPATAAVEVDGFLPGIVEDDGTCTLTVTQGATSVEVSVPGTADASSTNCGGATVPGADLQPGSWTAVLRYESPATRGSSDAAQVVVP